MKDIDIEKLDTNCKEGEVLIFYFDIDTYDIDSARNMYESLKQALPFNTIIGLPTGVKLKKKVIKDAIKELEELL